MRLFLWCAVIAALVIAVYVGAIICEVARIVRGGLSGAAGWISRRP